MVERALHLVEPSDKPAIVSTPFVRQVEEGVKILAAKGGHGLVVTSPGCGKTTILRTLADKYYDQCLLVTLHQWARSPTGGLRALLDVLSTHLGKYCPSSTEPQRTFYLVTERLELLRQNTGHRPVVMIDEGQIARDALLNGFRYFADEDLCALLVAANHRFFDPKTGEVAPGLEPLYQRRRFLIERVGPDQGDVNAIFDAYEISDKASRDLLNTVARERALRGVVQVIEAAQDLGGIAVPMIDDLTAAMLLQSRTGRTHGARLRR